MVDQYRLQTALREFAQTLVRRYDVHDVHDVLQRLGGHVARVLDVDGCGLPILDGGRLVLVTSTTALVERVEQLQVRLQEGPCIDGLRTPSHSSWVPPSSCWPPMRALGRHVSTRP